MKNFKLSFVSLAVAVSALSGAGCSSSSTTSPTGIAPDEGFSVVSNALSSAASVTGDELAKRSPRAYSITLDPKCDEHAVPVDSEGNYLDESSPEYASAVFYCQMKQPGGGPDTLQGAISQAAGFMCLFKDKLKFNGEPQVETVTLDGTCFPDSFIDEVGEVTAEGTITTSEIGAPLFGNADEWDYSVEVTATVDGDDVHLRLLVKSGDGYFAAAANDQVEGHENDGYSVLVDTNNGTLRYESKHQRYDEECGSSNCGWNRHNRMLISGTIEADGTFTDVTDVEAINANLYKNETDSPTNDSFGLLSIKGNPTDGFFTHNLKGNGDPALYANFASDVTNCAGGACDGNTGIGFSTTDDLDFLMGPTSSTLTTTVDWFEAIAPANYTAVTTADSQ